MISEDICFLNKWMEIKSDNNVIENIFTIREGENAIITFKNNDSVDNGIIKVNNANRLHRLMIETIPGCDYVLQSNLFWCSIWASLGESIPPLNAFHCRNFFGEVPCTKELTVNQIEDDYSKIVFEQLKMLYEKRFPYKMSAALIFKQGGIFWGNNLNEVVEYAICIEEIAKQAYMIRNLCGVSVKYMSYELMEKLYKGEI